MSDRSTDGVDREYQRLTPAEHIATGDTLCVARHPGPTLWLRKSNNEVAAVWTQGGAFCDARAIAAREAEQLIKIGDSVRHVDDPKNEITDSLRRCDNA